MFDSVIVELVRFMKSIGQANKQTNADKHMEMKILYSLSDYNKQTNKQTDIKQTKTKRLQPPCDYNN